MAQIDNNEAQFAIRCAKSITVVTTVHPESWKQRVPKECRERYSKFLKDTELREDSRVERGHPLFENRMKDLHSMMQRRATEEIKSYLISGNRLRIWPYELEIDSDYEFESGIEFNKPPTLDMDQEIEFAMYMDQGATITELAEMFGLTWSKAKAIYEEMEAS